MFALGKPFCEFTAGDGSSISAPLDVLAANGPTLAAIAYFYPPAFVPDGTTANPSYTCTASLAAHSILARLARPAAGGYRPMMSTTLARSACLPIAR